MNGREAVGPRVRRNAPEVEGRSGQTVPSPFVLSVARQREVEGSLSKDERGDTVVMSFWVYILRCGDGSYYTGHTDDLEHRLHQHQAGTFGGYTSSRKPLSLVYSCSFPSREEALGAERQIKGWSRKKKEAMLCGDWTAVNRLSRGKHKHQRS